MKWLGRIALASVVAVLMWQIWQRVFVTEESRVKKLISSMASAVEKNDLLRLEGAIAQDYSDDNSLDKMMLLAGARSFRQQYDQVLIIFSDMSVVIEPDHQKAQAVFIVKVLAKAKGSLSESEVRADRFRLFFRRTDQGWKLYRAESPELKFD